MVGYKKVKQIRAKLERLTGKQSIPVWHLSRGMDEFRGICKDYGYVAIGGIVSGEITKDKYKALIFDVDGSLVDSMWIWGAIDREYLAAFGHEVPEGLQIAKVDAGGQRQGGQYGKQGRNRQKNQKNRKQFNK